MTDHTIGRAELRRIRAVIGVLNRMCAARNPKSRTVTNEIGNAVKEVKQGKIDFKVDKAGIVHSSVGKAH